MSSAAKRPRGPCPESEWIAVANSSYIRPTMYYLERFTAAYARRTVTDQVYHFTFRNASCPAISIHESRLEWAEGPLAAFCKPGFAEHETKRVELAGEDDADTFTIIRSFLYGDAVFLQDKSIVQILRAIRSAHRWQLHALYDVLCRFVVAHGLIGGANDIIIVSAVVVQLPDLPEMFRDYFWKSVAEHFQVLVGDVGRSDGDQTSDQGMGNQECSKTDVSCPRFPGIWELALSHGVILTLLRDIEKDASPELAEELLMLVLAYVEPRIAEESLVTKLIELFLPKVAGREQDLAAGREGSVSSRALRLLLRSCSVQNQRSELTWNREWPMIGLQYAYWEFEWTPGGGRSDEGDGRPQQKRRKRQTFYLCVTF